MGLQKDLPKVFVGTDKDNLEEVKGNRFDVDDGMGVRSQVVLTKNGESVNVAVSRSTEPEPYPHAILTQRRPETVVAGLIVQAKF